MRQYLSAQIQAASQIELDEMVDPTTMRNLKAREEHPEIRLYSIGHEGEANLHLPGIGKKTFTWIQAMVRKVGEVLGVGTPVFDRHDPDTNSHEGRTQIGEVVGKAVKTVGDRLNTLAAIYVYPNFKSRPLDVASFEADIEYGHDGHQAWPTNINNVSGIALSDSGIDSPGFPGATFLGAVQAAVQGFGNEIGDNKMNQSEVKAAIAELKLSPSDLFSVEDVVADKKVRTNLQEAATRVGKERDTAREKVAELENTNAEKDKKLLQHDVQSKSASVFDAILADPARKLDDNAKKFIQRSLKNFSSVAENEDALKVDVGKFVDASVVEYGELAKDVFGVKVAETPANPAAFTLTPEQTVAGQQQQTTPARPAANIPPPRSEVLDAEMNPDTNPLIPGGKAAEEALKT